MDKVPPLSVITSRCRTSSSGCVGLWASESGRRSFARMSRALVTEFAETLERHDEVDAGDRAVRQAEWVMSRR